MSVLSPKQIAERMDDPEYSSVRDYLDTIAARDNELTLFQRRLKTSEDLRTQLTAMLTDGERVAQLTAHRATHAAEHNPSQGRIHGYCIVCGVPWPCEYAGKPPRELSI